MAIWNQTAGWSSGSLYFEGSTSGRELFRFQGDNVNIPPLIGRINLDIITPTAIEGVVGSVANPTTEEIWIDKIVVNIDTASSSSCALSLGIANTASSSATNIANNTIGCSTSALAGGLLLVGYTTSAAIASLPMAWGATQYFTVTAVSSSAAAAAVVGDISVFYCVAVTT